MKQETTRIGKMAKRKSRLVNMKFTYINNKTSLWWNFFKREKESRTIMRAISVVETLHESATGSSESAAAKHGVRSW